MDATRRHQEDLFANVYNHEVIDTSTTVYGLLQMRRLLALAGAAVGEVVDVGCSNSVLPRYLSNGGHRAIGLDISATALLMARSRSSAVDYVCAIAECLPFRDKCVDTVIMGELIEHVDDPGKTLREASRIARAKVLVSTPNLLTNPLAVQSADHRHVFDHRRFLRTLNSVFSEIRLLPQPAFVPVPNFVARAIYNAARNRYVIGPRGRGDPVVLLFCTDVMLRLLVTLCKAIPILGLSLVAECSVTGDRM